MREGTINEHDEIFIPTNPRIKPKFKTFLNKKSQGDEKKILKFLVVEKTPAKQKN